MLILISYIVLFFITIKMGFEKVRNGIRIMKDVFRALKIQKKLTELNLDAFVCTNPVNIFYLTNFSGSSGVAVITPEKVYIITDFRYFEQVEKESPQAILIKQNDLLSGDKCLIKFLIDLDIKRIGFEANNVSVQRFNYWKDELPRKIELVSMVDLVEDIAMIKDEDEIILIRKSADIVSKALIQTFDIIKPGIKERDVIAELNYNIMKQGGDGISFDTIVASGWRGALPHASINDKIINDNEFIVIDCGARYCGYSSDITRTVILSEPTEEQRRIWDIVLRAQTEAIKSVRPGIELSELDGIARKIIQDEGFGENFGHGLGHGVGLSVHTKPRLGKTAKGKLQEGMVLTIEPGIYLTDKEGVRIEDMILITSDGCEVLTNVPKKMVIGERRFL